MFCVYILSDEKFCIYIESKQKKLMKKGIQIQDPKTYKLKKKKIDKLVIIFGLEYLKK